MTARTSTGIGSQLNEMMNTINQYSLNPTPLTGSNTVNLSFLTFLWPLLPVLTPEPPLLVTELLRQQETCDVCGTVQGTPLTACNKSSAGIWQLARSGTCASETTLHRRQQAQDSAVTPLEKLMADMELRMDETLESIESTIKNSKELSKKAKEVEDSQRSDMSDAEMLKMLQSLVKEKAKREERVKILELKEDQLKESLKLMIDYAKSIPSRKGDSDPPLDKEVLDQAAQAQEKLDSLLIGGENASQGLNLLIDEQNLSTKEKDD